MEIQLNNTIYNLEKIKEEDIEVFLQGCKVFGKKCRCCFPFFCGCYTREYKIARKFFDKKGGNRTR